MDLVEAESSVLQVFGWWSTILFATVLAFAASRASTPGALGRFDLSQHSSLLAGVIVLVGGLSPVLGPFSRRTSHSIAAHFLILLKNLRGTTSP